MSENNIQNMVGFIRAEAAEKKTEIERDADEQFNIEKQRIVENEKKKLKAEFEKREKQLETEKRIRASNLQKEQRLKVDREREKLLDGLLADCKTQLTQFVDSGSYADCLANLIAESAKGLDLGSAAVTIKCKKDQKGKVKDAANAAKGIYKKATGADLQATISDDFLPDDVIGGVVVSGANGRVSSNNTFTARLENIQDERMPYIRDVLFD